MIFFWVLHFACHKPETSYQSIGTIGIRHYKRHCNIPVFVVSNRYSNQELSFQLLSRTYLTFIFKTVFVDLIVLVVYRFMFAMAISISVQHVIFIYPSVFTAISFYMCLFSQHFCVDLSYRRYVYNNKFWTYEIRRHFYLQNRLPKLYLAKLLGMFGPQCSSTSFLFCLLIIFFIRASLMTLEDQTRVWRKYKILSWYLWWVYFDWFVVRKPTFLTQFLLYVNVWARITLSMKYPYLLLCHHTGFLIFVLLKTISPSQYILK